jgi:hypothetical protein
MGATVVVGRTSGRAWKGVRATVPGTEPWVFGQALLSKVIRYRGDLESFLDELFKGQSKAWDRLGEKAGRAGPRDIGPGEWLYLIDVEARTLRILGGDEVYEELTFNHRGRSTPLSIERPPAPWASVPVVDGWRDAVWLEELETAVEGLEAVPSVISALASRLPQDEVRVVWPMAPEAAYWSLRLEGKTLLYPTQRWREAVGWAQRSPNVLTVWKPLWDELPLDVGPGPLCDMVGEDRWAFELISSTWRARGGKGDLVYADQPLPRRRWSVVTQVRDPNRELKPKGRKQQAGDRIERDVGCPGWQWQLLDWLRWHQLTEGN